jgi:hypothetical protein
MKPILSITLITIAILINACGYSPFGGGCTAVALSLQVLPAVLLVSFYLKKWLVLILNRLKHVNRLQNTRELWGAFPKLSGFGLG